MRWVSSISERLYTEHKTGWWASHKVVVETASLFAAAPWVRTGAPVRFGV